MFMNLLFCFFLFFFIFFFNDTATTEIYTLSLHDALPISPSWSPHSPTLHPAIASRRLPRSEEHTSELQSQSNLVCRLLLEKKKKQTIRIQQRNQKQIAHHIPLPKVTVVVYGA